MDVTSLNHAGQRKRWHLSQNAWVISAGEAYGSRMTCRRLPPEAPVRQVCSALASPQPSWMPEALEGKEEAH